MARRRLNKRFLIGLGASAFGIVLTLFIANRVLVRKDADKLMQMGDIYVRERRFLEAAQQYGAAAGARPTDPTIMIKYGDAMHLLAAAEPEYASKALSAWNKALELDPVNREALSRLLDNARQVAEATNSSQAHSNVRDLARRTVEADPTDLKARALLHTSSIQAWIAGVATEWPQIEEDLAALAGLMMQDPGNSDLPTYIANARLKHAVEMRQRGIETEALQEIDLAVGAFDEPLKTQADSAAMHFRAASILGTAMALDSRADRREAYRNRQQALLLKAQTLAKPDDPFYSQIVAAAAEQMLQDGKPQEAEKVLRQVAVDRPGDPIIRLSLARLLTRQNRRDEAMQILDRPLNVQASLGVNRLLIRELEAKILLELTSLRLDTYATLKDEAERAERLEKIQQGVNTILERYGEIPNTLILKGRLERLQGDNIAAIQTLNRALQLQAQFGGGRDDQLNFMLAECYLAANQTGEARTLLEGIVQRHESHLPSRLMLVSLLIREGRGDEAAVHIDRLEKLLPDSADLGRLRLAQYQLQGKTAEADALYAQLPETDAQRKLVKAQVALDMKKSDEAIRLLQAVRAENPNDVTIAHNLIRVYMAADQRDKARALLEEATRSHPDDPTLSMLAVNLSDATPEDRTAARREAIEAIADEYTREIRLFALARAENRPDDALAHLRKAEQVKPDENEVLELLFDHHVRAEAWTEADAYLGRLAVKNADRAGGLLYRVRYAMARGRADEAVRTARELASKMPEFAQSWVVLGQALQVANQFDEAIQSYTKAIEKQSTNPDALGGIVACYYALGRPDDAWRAIQQARKAIPGALQFAEQEIAHQLRYGTGGGVDAAVASRLAARDRNPDDPRAWAALGVAYFEGARTKLRLGQTGSDQLIAKLRETATGAIEKWPDERMFYGQLADAHLAAGDLTGAEAAIKRLLNRDRWKDSPDAYRMLTELYLQSARLDDAESAYQQMAARTEQTVDLQLRLAASLTAARQFDRAVKLLEANADDIRIRRQLVQTHLDAGKADHAESVVKAMLDKEPDAPDLHSLLAAVYLNMRNYDGALSRVNAALGIDPNHSQARYYRALVLLQRQPGDPDAAADDLVRLRDKEPGNLDVRVALAEAYVQLNDVDNAIRELSAAQSINPASKPIRTRLLDLYATARPPRWNEAEAAVREARLMPQFANDPDWGRIEANMWLLRGNGQRAMEAITAAVQKAPDNLTLVQTYLNVLLQTGQHQRVLDESAQVLKADDGLWWAYQIRALALRRMDKRVEAMAEFEKALATPVVQKSDDLQAAIVANIAREIGVDEAVARIEGAAETEPRWRFLLASLYQGKRDYTRSVATIERVLADFDNLTPNDRERALRLAGAIYLGHRPQPLNDKAYDVYVRLAKLAPDDIATMNNLACLLSDSLSPPRPDEAVQYSQRAIDLMHRAGQVEPLIMDTHGWALILAGRLDEGIGLLREVVEKRPFPEACYHLGEGYLRKAFPEEAIKHLTHAQDLYDRAERANLPVDPTLRPRLTQAIDRAQQMMREHSEAKLP